MSPNGIYATRTSRAWCGLAGEQFNIINHEGADALAFVGGGCIDAPDQIPAGSVKSYGTNFPFVAPVLLCRLEEGHAELAEREAIAKRLIDEILAEEAK